MKKLPIHLGFLVAFTIIALCDAKEPTRSSPSNDLVINLQGGFDHGAEVTISVDKRKIYRATPKTNPLLGIADGVSVSTASDHPIITFEIAARKIKWLSEIDLTKGRFLGISVTPDGKVQILQQAQAFGYD